MSSEYTIICVSHDPAINIVDWDVFRSPEDALAVAHDRPDTHHFMSQHKNCDLLVGRESGALVEVACPGSIGRALPPGAGCRGYHMHTFATWTGVGWLRLLAMAFARGEDVSALKLPDDFSTG